MRKIAQSLLIPSLVVFSIGCSFAQKADMPQIWPCGDEPQLLVDSSGKPIWIDSNELKQHGISMPGPKLPSSIRAMGKLTVDVVIGPDGRVKCIRAEKGHPLLRRALIEAVKTWRFLPFSAGKHPVSVYGHLEFSFER